MKRILILAVLLALAACSGCATPPERHCNPLNGACSYGDEHSGSKTLKWNRTGGFYI